MSKEKPKRSKRRSGDEVPPERGEQAEILASSSDEKKPQKALARDRQPKPKEAEKLKRAIRPEQKQERGDSPS